MANYLNELERMANDPRFSQSNAASLFESAEYGIAATELIEEVYDQKASVSALQKETLLEYLKEYGHGDKDVFDAYANLLNQEDW